MWNISLSAIQDRQRYMSVILCRPYRTDKDLCRSYFVYHTGPTKIYVGHTLSIIQDRQRSMLVILCLSYRTDKDICRSYSLSVIQKNAIATRPYIHITIWTTMYLMKWVFIYCYRFTWEIQTAKLFTKF